MKKLLSVLFLLTPLAAYAVIVPLQVKEGAITKEVPAKVVNLLPDTQIDLTTMQGSGWDNIAISFAFSSDEQKAHEKMLQGQSLDPNEINIWVQGLNKMLNKRGLSNAEIKELFFTGKSPTTIENYFYKKEAKELGI